MSTTARKQTETKPIRKGPLCDCGELVQEVDPERKYLVIVGDGEERRHIEEPFYCKECMTGIERSEIY